MKMRATKTLCKVMLKAAEMLKLDTESGGEPPDLKERSNEA